MTTHPLADGLDAAADHLTTMDRAIPALAVPAGVFGPDRVGVPGRLSRDLHAHWAAVLSARSAEAAAGAAELAALADSVRATHRAYEITDDDAARRIERSAR